uniref:Uncharacterized protein n=1 Tax=Ditylenchus dipsaci TaxID=166011 RepID=A0A915EMP4_9BILA
MPTRMDKHINLIGNVVSDLTKVGQEFLSPETIEEVKKLDEALKDRLATKASQIQLKQETQAATALQPPQPAVFVGSKGVPPGDFRFLSVTPQPDDIRSCHRVYLRAAKKTGEYDDGEHYLDVQFRLLREDLIRP